MTTFKTRDEAFEDFHHTLRQLLIDEGKQDTLYLQKEMIAANIWLLYEGTILYDEGESLVHGMIIRAGSHYLVFQNKGDKQKTNAHNFQQWWPERGMTL